MGNGNKSRIIDSSILSTMSNLKTSIISSCFIFTTLNQVSILTNDPEEVSWSESRTSHSLSPLSVIEKKLPVDDTTRGIINCCLCTTHLLLVLRDMSVQRYCKFCPFILKRLIKLRIQQFKTSIFHLTEYCHSSSCRQIKLRFLHFLLLHDNREIFRSSKIMGIFMLC